MNTIHHVLAELKQVLVDVPVVLETHGDLLVYGPGCLDAVGEVLGRCLVDIKKTEWIDNHFKIEIDYNSCIMCGDILGSCNPRQYCKKLYCPNASVSPLLLHISD
jgi:hypothetical protein